MCTGTPAQSCISDNLVWTEPGPGDARGGGIVDASRSGAALGEATSDGSLIEVLYAAEPFAALQGWLTVSGSRDAARVTLNSLPALTM